MVFTRAHTRCGSVPRSDPQKCQHQMQVDLGDTPTTMHSVPAIRLSTELSMQVVGW